MRPRYELKAKAISTDSIEVRHQTQEQDGEYLDEIVTLEPCHVHLERMNDSDWWMELRDTAGRRLVVTLYAKRAVVHAFAEWDGSLRSD